MSRALRVLGDHTNATQTHLRVARVVAHAGMLALVRLHLRCDLGYSLDFEEASSPNSTVIRFIRSRPLDFSLTLRQIRKRQSTPQIRQLRSLLITGTKVGPPRRI